MVNSHRITLPPEMDSSTPLYMQMRTAGGKGDYGTICYLLEQGVSFKHAVRGASEANNKIALDSFLFINRKLYHYALEGALAAGDMNRAAEYYEVMINNGWTLHGVSGFKDAITPTTIAYYFQFTVDILRPDIPFQVPEEIRDAHSAFRGALMTNHPTDMILQFIHDEKWMDVQRMLQLPLGLFYIGALGSFIVRLTPSKLENFLDCVRSLPSYVSIHMLNIILDHAIVLGDLGLTKRILDMGACMRIMYPEHMEREVAELFISRGYSKDVLVSKLSHSSALYRYYCGGKIPYLKEMRLLAAMFISLANNSCTK